MTKPTTTGDILERLREIIETITVDSLESIDYKKNTEKAVQKIVALIEEEVSVNVKKVHEVYEYSVKNEQSTDKPEECYCDCHEGSDHIFPKGCCKCTEEKPLEEKCPSCKGRRTSGNQACLTCLGTGKKPLEEKCIMLDCELKKIVHSYTHPNCSYSDKNPPEQPLTCEKHSRILIGKKKCTDCEKEKCTHEMSGDMKSPVHCIKYGYIPQLKVKTSTDVKNAIYDCIGMKEAPEQPEGWEKEYDKKWNKKHHNTKRKSFIRSEVEKSYEKGYQDARDRYRFRENELIKKAKEEVINILENTAISCSGSCGAGCEIAVQNLIKKLI